ncbi:hypothetical protein HDG33_007280 [Paraburkholderia sp. Cpub6]|nr:hypothetical protein [Paraburkholderia sp. Cpub6]
MSPQVLKVLWIEGALAVGSAIALVATVLWPQWLEMTLGLKPDGRDGSSEWGLTFALATLTVLFVVRAGWTWRRYRTR